MNETGISTFGQKEFTEETLAIANNVKVEQLDRTLYPNTAESVKFPSIPKAQENRIRRMEGEIGVAFFASLSSDVYHLGQNQNIKFDQVVTNVGNAYDKYLGVFRATVEGIYVFSTSLITGYKDSSHFGIFLNNQRLTLMYLHGDENSYDGSSNTVVLSLKQNDDISVRHIDTNKSVYGDSGSLFSGFLLKQTDTQVSIVG